ncbi:MAG TPA: thiamine-phosphate kinase [Candidatus Polarisedimenticolia bacterium]|jgi:thiamine-monophosphate kinase|nr:thiamine-phosphate kinase [Candidatus Polarisedimenticolia bacterium]
MPGAIARIQAGTRPSDPRHLTHSPTDAAKELRLSRWSAAGEESLVRRIRRIFPPPPAGVRVAIGDDAACVRLSGGEDLVLTTDQMVEGVHFRRSTHPPELLGARALTVNLSDVAGMGARPRWFLLSLFLPQDLPDRYLEGLLAGLSTEARRRRVSLVGGNLTASPVLAVDICLAGSLPRGTKPLLRSGGRAGDLLFVTGSLGGSALGLELLQEGWRLTGQRAARRGQGARLAAAALRSHLAPAPDYTLARNLARRRIASAAIDLSDGLSTDLHRLCLASGTGARIETERLPVSEAALRLRGKAAAIGMALHGGEDYQLLFAVPPRKIEALERLARAPRITRIGVLTSSPKRLVAVSAGKAVPLIPAGHDHLRGGGTRRR